MHFIYPYKYIKKGNLSIKLNKVAKKIGKKSTKTTTTDGKVFVYKSGNVKITLTVTKSNGKTKTKTVKLKAEEVEIDVSDIDELVEKYL